MRFHHVSAERSGGDVGRVKVEDMLGKEESTIHWSRKIFLDEIIEVLNGKSG